MHRLATTACSTPSPPSASTEEDWFNNWEFKGNPWDYYGKPDAENPFRKWSPALSAKNFKTPTLVVHGQLDYRLDVSEGFQLFDTLQLLKVPSKMLYFPDEGHWVLKPQNSRLWYKTVNDWVDQWTKTRIDSFKLAALNDSLLLSPTLERSCVWDRRHVFVPIHERHR